ncbi:MAG: DUF1194 domain-containing protein [Rhizobiales bacterium]|nr:DUF1194 domain-containing protein [Hyphomicrobiales bacterium]
MRDHPFLSLLRPAVVVLALLTAHRIATATPAFAEVPVDLELVLAVDVSLSMDFEEQRLQREGYVAALAHPSVVEAIRSGLHGRIAVTYVEWAGQSLQSVVVPWRAIGSSEEAEAVAGELAALPISRARRTSISGAIRHAASLFDGNGFAGLRRVIDVSGDGPNNSGVPVTEARDEVAARGITINGLALRLANRRNTHAFFDIADLHRYYIDCVIGGTGAFALEVTERENFAAAIRRKMLLEIAGHGPTPTPSLRAFGPAVADYTPASAEVTDCLIGEKRWRQYIDNFSNE